MTMHRERRRRIRLGRRPVLTVLWVALVAAACSDAGPELTLSIDPPASTQVTVGDFLTLAMSATSGVAGVTWSSSDEQTAVVLAGTVEARRPGPVTITVSAAGATSGEIELDVVERPGGYTADEVDYFTEIAFGAEFGGASPLLRRWREGSGPLIRLNGSPSSGDLTVLDSVIAEINRLAPVDMEIVTDFPTVEMHFIPQDDFQTVLPQAPTGNNGIVWLWWDGTDHLIQSVVLISTTSPEPLRAHIIREEVTQMLGLLQDSFRYPQSIFYQNVSQTTEYLPIDRTVIELLYRPELDVGMTLEHAAQVARTLLKPIPLLARARAGEVPSGDGTRGPDASGAPSWWWGVRDGVPDAGRPGSAGGG